jgi:RHS repeat-associated protein
MLPVYDDNGNTTRMCEAASGEPVVVAGYEHGPFGEVRSITGVDGLRNPIRRSTKWADNETGLVYYGYRYYSASTGRWLSRDPIGESADADLARFFGNRAVCSANPLGLWSYSPNYGKFDVSFGPFSFGDPDAGPDEYQYPTSKMILEYKAWRQFCALICTEVAFVQIIATAIDPLVRVGAGSNVTATSWTDSPRFEIDSSDSAAEYPLYASQSDTGGLLSVRKNPSEGQLSVLLDHPGYDDALSPLNPNQRMRQQLETCAVCSKGAGRGTVYGCVIWGHYFDGIKAFDRFFLVPQDATTGVAMARAPQILLATGIRISLLGSMWHGGTTAMRRSFLAINIVRLLLRL